MEIAEKIWKMALNRFPGQTVEDTVNRGKMISEFWKLENGNFAYFKLTERTFEERQFDALEAAEARQRQIDTENYLRTRLQDEQWDKDGSQSFVKGTGSVFMGMGKKGSDIDLEMVVKLPDTDGPLESEIQIAGAKTGLYKSLKSVGK